jgi:hypothetical protein
MENQQSREPTGSGEFGPGPVSAPCEMCLLSPHFSLVSAAHREREREVYIYMEGGLGKRETREITLGKREKRK